MVPDEGNVDGDDDGEPARGRRPLRGIVAAAVLCFCLASATALRLPVFFGADERPHFAYAAAVAHGDLPTLDDRIPVEDERFPILERWADGLAATGDRVRVTVFVANHPPLFYAAAAGPLWLASLSGSDVVAPLTLRLLNAGFMSLGVVLTGLLAREVFARSSRRDGLAVVAAGLTAVTPNLVGVAAFGHNDGIGFALGTGSLLVALRLVRRGPDARLVALASALAAGCVLARASLAPTVVLLAVAALVGGWRHVPAGRRVARSLLAGGTVLAVPVLAAGWFYLRNHDLYGTPTGDRHNLEILRRTAGDRSVVEVLTSWQFHRDLWTGLYGSVHPHLVLAAPGVVLAGLVAVVVAGLVVVRRQGQVRPTPGDVALGVVVAGYVAAVGVGIADHVAQGGSSHPRYLLPLVPLLGVAVAAAVGVLARWRMVAAAGLTALAAATTSLLLRYGSLVDQRERDGEVPLPDPPAAVGLSWLAFALAGVGLVLVLRALARPVAVEVATSPPVSPAPPPPPAAGEATLRADPAMTRPG
jgi:hypothetical protein